MANQTARRNFGGLVDAAVIGLRPSWSTSADTNFYEGAAVLQKLEAGSAENDGYGTCIKTLDGTVQGVFAGVVQKNVTVPADTDTTFSAGPDPYKYILPVQRRGAVEFNAVSGYTPALTDIGRNVFFHSDNEVNLTPPTGSTKIYPILAGQIIDFPATGKVLVDITHAVGRRPLLQYLSFTVPSVTVASLNNNTIELMAKAAAATATSFQFGRRVWLNRLITTVLTAVDVATVNVQHSKNNAAYATAQAVATTDAAGKSLYSTTTLQVAYDPTDCMGLALQSTGNVTTGELLLTLEILPLQ